MSAILTPFSLVITCTAGWLNQHQQRTIDYLVEENRVLQTDGPNSEDFTTDGMRSASSDISESLRSSFRTIRGTNVFSSFDHDYYE